MISKTCENCGEYFKSTRSDAQFCSKKCRNSANYKKKNPKSKAVLKSNPPKRKRLTHYSTKDIQALRTAISNIENELDELINNREKLAKQVVLLKNGTMLQVHNRLNLSDSALYNVFLNKKYLERKRNGDSFADFSLISTADLGKDSSKHCRQAVDEYRLRLQIKLDNLSQEVQLIEQQISSINERIELKKLKLTDLYDEIVHARNVVNAE